jgi:transcriptional regulator with XRE-family HTH domain
MSSSKGGVMSHGAFGKWLEAELAARKWSQSDFSRKTGISQPHISRILAGRDTNLTESTKAKIMKEIERTSDMVPLPEFARRMLPIIGVDQVPAFRKNGYEIKKQAERAKQTFYAVDAVSDKAFALVIQEDKYTPKYHAGDILIIDTKLRPKTGNIVVTLHGAAINVKYYHETEEDIRLIDFAADEPQLVFNKHAQTKLDIVGVLVGVYHKG